MLSSSIPSKNLTSLALMMSSCLDATDDKLLILKNNPREHIRDPSNFLFCPFLFNAITLLLIMRKNPTYGFSPDHASYGVLFSSVLVGHLFRKNVAALTASAYNDFGNSA